MKTVKSLAGTSRTYVVAQVRPRGNGKVNIQVNGPKGNRYYGHASEVSAPALAAYLKGLSTTKVEKVLVEVEKETSVSVFND